MAKRLAVHGIDKIYSSPMKRAMDTAKPTSKLLGIPIEIEDWTREVGDKFTVTLSDGSKDFVVNIPNTEFRNKDNFNLGEKIGFIPRVCKA